MHSAATQSALHFHVTQILIENPRQHLTTQPFGNIQHRFLSRHFAPTRHIVPFAVLGWDILILLKKIACHRETNPPLSPPFWRYAYACAMVFMTRILSFETDYPRVSRNPTRWSRGTKTLGTRLGAWQMKTVRIRTTQTMLMTAVTMRFNCVKYKDFIRTAFLLCVSR